MVRPRPSWPFSFPFSQDLRSEIIQCRPAERAVRSRSVWPRGSPRMTYVVALPCVDLLDRTCIDECPVDCIYEGERMMYIHPDECVDCGACEPVCPVDAITYEAYVPGHLKDYYRVNVDFFENIGSPGGASRVGKIHQDHPIVAAMPYQPH